MLAVLVAGISIGAAISAGLPGRLLDGSRASQEAAPVPAASPGTSPTSATPLDLSGAGGEADGQARRAGSPASAVEQFLAAEAEGRLTDAFGLLSGADREEFGSPSGYVAAHADVLPPVLSHTVLDVEEAADRTAVVTEVVFRASLDQVAGLVAGRAEVTWSAVAEDGGWAVELASAEVVPIEPAEAQASQDVARWARARQTCAPAPPDSEHAALLGRPALAETLCDAAGEVAVGQVTGLAELDAGPFLAAYGGEVMDWARVVDVSAPTELRAVVAPIGDRWTVIGVLVAGARR